MHNPLRSEADVFRLVVVTGVAAALVVGLTLLTSAAHWASDVDEGMGLARERMARSVSALRGVGVEVRAEVVDPDPNMAIEDALRVFPADEIVISTLPPDQSRWLEHEVVERTRREVELPMTHVVVDPAAAASRAA